MTSVSVHTQFGNGDMVECNRPSSYARTITTKDRECNRNKLTFQFCVVYFSKQPNVQWPDIYTYLFEKPSCKFTPARNYKHTSQQMLQTTLSVVKYHGIDSDLSLLSFKIGDTNRSIFLIVSSVQRQSTRLIACRHRIVSV